MNILSGLQPSEDKGVVSHHHLFHPAEGNRIEMNEITKGHQADITRSRFSMVCYKDCLPSGSGLRLTLQLIHNPIGARILLLYNYR
jgi:hypothetical protein